MIRGLQSKLRRAMTRRAFVRVERSIEPGRTDGFVVGVGKDWFVLQAFEAGAHSSAGYMAFRSKDVSLLTVPAPNQQFAAKALRLRGLRRQVPKGLKVGSLPALMRSANGVEPVVTIHLEALAPETCYIGRVATVAKREVELHEITPGAKWKRTTTVFLLADITRVDFGGPYEDALARIGGRPPVPRGSRPWPR
jgi:hypothetical protein